jgi:hypothetical protein
MSQVAPRAIALQEANKLGLTDAKSVLDAANAFVDFILAGDLPSPTGSTGPAPLPKGPAPAPKAAKPAAPKAASKPVETEPEPETETDGETVGSIIDKMLKAKKRDQAVKLLKDFGATSVSGVKAAKAADFIAQGLAILNGEAEADLTE